IMGAGIVEKATGKPAEFEVNEVDSLEELVRKVIVDYLIFSIGVIEVQYNVFGDVVALNHIPVHHNRANKPLTKFWVSDDWKAKKSVLTYDRWKRGKNED